MPSKDALVIYAGSVAFSYPKMTKEDRCSFLKDMYDRTLLERPVNWTLDMKQGGTNLEALRAGRWLRKNGTPGGTSVEKEGIAWCGIFATYCLRAIGIPAQWKQNIGISAPSNMLERRAGYFHADQIGPGDICVVKENQHHFIVRHRAGNMLYSYDGNLTGQMIGEQSYNIDTLLTGVKDQVAYDQSLIGKMLPDDSKYSFYFYRLLF